MGNFRQVAPICTLLSAFSIRGCWTASETYRENTVLRLAAATARAVMELDCCLVDTCLIKIQWQGPEGLNTDSPINLSSLS